MLDRILCIHMKIKNKQPIKTLSGDLDLKTEDGKGTFTVGMALSNIILSHKQGGAMKLYNLAKSFYNKEEVEIDNTDYVLITDAVEKTEAYGALITGQVMEILLDIKTRSDIKESKPEKTKTKTK